MMLPRIGCERDLPWRRASVMRNVWTTRVVMTTAASLILFQTSFGRAPVKGDDGFRYPDEHLRALGGRITSSPIDLQCPTCDQIHCTPRRASKLRCKGGISRGICNCCPVCAKTEGESCGGQWHYLGKCDADLFCEPDKGNQVIPFDSANTATFMTSVSEVTFWGHRYPEGKCRKRLTMNDAPQTVDKCHPKCTPEYCRAHPKDVCSAVESAERKQPCQADCQHTSCSACTYVRPETECIRCRKDDFVCIRKFGRCIRRLHCNRTKQKCRLDKNDKRLKFQCLVPGCLVP